MRKITFNLMLTLCILLSLQYSYGSITILNHTPAINAINVQSSINITIQFSTSINTSTLTGNNVRLYGSQSGLHSSVLTYNTSNNTVTINPNVDFRAGETVEIIVTQNVKSTANDSLAKPYVWRFDTDVTLGATGYVLDTSISGAVHFGSILFDCDNDGDLDAAGGDHEAGNMRIYKNNGSGDFSTFTTLTGGGLAYTTYAPKSADFNCDGYMDLAVPVRFSNIISIWFGNGSGNFSPAQQVGVNAEPQEVSIADFNGDGYLDVVAVCNNSVTFYYDILINDKTGHFNLTQQINVPARPDFCNNGDIDNDGDIDILAAVAGSSASNCYILFNNGNGAFSVSQILINNTGATPAPGDFDGDGDLDLIVNGNATSSVFGMKVLKNNGSGTFIEGQLFGTQSVEFAYGLKYVKDINNDGFLDIVTSFNGTIEIYKNDGIGNFSLFISIPNNGWPAYSMGVGDISGNGSMGICTPGNEPWVLNIYKAVSPPPPPPAPVLVSPLNNTVGSLLTVTMIWNASPAAVSYRLQVAADAGFSTLILNDSTLTSTSRIISGLTPLTTYYWRVNAKNSNGISGWSSVWNFRTKGTPANITLLLPLNNAVDIPTAYIFRWSKAYDQTTKLMVSNYWYELVKDTVTMSNRIIDSTLIDTLKAVSAMSNSTLYFWRVKAKNEIGWSGFTNWFKFTTMLSAPAAPVLISPPNGSLNQPTTLRFFWSKPVFTVTFKLQIAYDSLFTNILVNDSTLTDTTIVVTNLPNNKYFWWRLSAKNAVGTSPFSTIWKFGTFLVGLEQIASDIPKVFRLYNSYPNPFNPKTKIRFDIPLSKGSPGRLDVLTRIIIYDVLGRQVETLIDEQLQPGAYEVDFDGNNYPSGVYFYKFESVDFTAINKMVLLK